MLIPVWEIEATLENEYPPVVSEALSEEAAEEAVDGRPADSVKLKEALLSEDMGDSVPERVVLLAAAPDPTDSVLVPACDTKEV